MSNYALYPQPVKRQDDFAETFQWVDSMSEFKFTMSTSVKKLVEACNYDRYIIFSKSDASEYLHNEFGAAVLDLNTGARQFWLKGKQLNKEESAKFVHDVEFGNNFLESLKKE